MEKVVVATPHQSLALTNCVFINPAECLSLGDSPQLEIIVNGTSKFVYAARAHDDIAAGCIALNSIMRRGCGVSNGESVTCSRVAHTVAAASVTFAVGFVTKKAVSGTEEVDCVALIALIRSVFAGQFFGSGQSAAVDFQGTMLNLSCTAIEQLLDASTITKSDTQGRGLIMPQTQINLAKAAGAPITLVGNESQATNTAIFKSDFSFEAMGIGGLDREFQDIFRRAFASRIFPAAVVKKLGVRHVKGMLLYGPPGTGKTLIARQIGKMLNGKEPKIVNGPEILSKFVGQSEENIRKLFEDADAEYAARGDDSDLHIIIFDEIDSVCKQRGARSGDTGVGDTVVNQLLSKIDGVNSLNNILVIGMTNRKDMMDDALLRPGRLEVQVEISLPDEAGRLQIVNIHTAPMREAKYLGDDVSLAQIAADTKNYSGAEIEGVVKSAASYAFARQVQIDNMKSVDASKLSVSKQDFDRALDEVRPAFGVSADDLQACVRAGILDYGRPMQEMLSSASTLVKQLQSSEHTSLLSILLDGPVGSGKTAIAAQLALQSGFPFVKLISPTSMLGMHEASKAAHIVRIFDNAHKSPMSLIVLDEIERLLEYVRVGPRFSNTVLQTLLTCIKRTPPSSKLVILGTTACADVLEGFELRDAFNVHLHVPTLGQAEAKAVLKELGISNAAAIEPALRTVEVGIPIKKLLLVIEMSLNADGGSVDPVRFTSTLHEVGLLTG